MFLFSSRRRHTRCALVTGVQTCALPIWLQPRRSTVRYKTNDVLTVGGNDTADAASLPSHRVRTLRPAHHNLHIRSGRRAALRDVHPTGLAGPITATTATPVHDPREIGRASCRERVCQYV